MSVGRNDPCPCGSGKKYKKCCGAATLDPGPYFAERARTRILGELVAFATGRQFDDEFRRAAEIYWEGAVEAANLDEMIARMEPDFARIAFIEWYVHDFRLADRRTFIEHFLTSRRAALDAAERAFLEQAQKTFVSLYLVLDVRLEEGLTLHDLLLDRTVDVRERSATRSLVKWDIFAARLMERDGSLIIVGGVIPFRAQDREPLVSRLKRAFTRYRRDHPEATLEEFLKENAAWFNHRMQEILQTPPPHLITPERDPVVFCKSHYRVTDKAAVVNALREAPEFDEDEDGDFAWHEDLGGGRLRSLAKIEWTEEGLTVSCMSEERLARARTLLERAAGQWLVHRGDTLQDPWKALELAGELPPDPNPLPRELEEPAYLKYKEEHYRLWPDSALPYLDGKTPRQAVRTAGGRRRVADLIRMLENGEERNRREKGFGYDVSWMWTELRLDPLGRSTRTSPSKGKI